MTTTQALCPEHAVGVHVNGSHHMWCPQGGTDCMTWADVQADGAQRVFTLGTAVMVEAIDYDNATAEDVLAEGWNTGTAHVADECADNACWCHELSV